jgi:hypothetical protein
VGVGDGVGVTAGTAQATASRATVSANAMTKPRLFIFFSLPEETE